MCAGQPAASPDIFTSLKAGAVLRFKPLSLALAKEGVVHPSVGLHFYCHLKKRRFRRLVVEYARNSSLLRR